MAKSESKDLKQTVTQTQVQAVSDSFNTQNYSTLADSQNVTVTFPGDTTASGVLSGLLPPGLDVKAILLAGLGVAVVLLGLKYFMKR